MAERKFVFYSASGVMFWSPEKMKLLIVWPDIVTSPSDWHYLTIFIEVRVQLKLSTSVSWDIMILRFLCFSVANKLSYIFFGKSNRDEAN
jgi:hypothetical protein